MARFAEMEGSLENIKWEAPSLSPVSHLRCQRPDEAESLSLSTFLPASLDVLQESTEESS